MYKDGWGISKGSEKYDATKLSHPVHVDELEKDCPFRHLRADGEFVGFLQVKWVIQKLDT